MSHGLGYIVAQAVRAGLRNPWAFTAWTISLAVILLSGTTLIVLPTDQGDSPITETFLLAKLSPLISEDEIARLGWEIWGWPGVAQIKFRFPGEEDPAPIADRTLVVQLAEDAVAAEIQARLLDLAEVKEVQFVQRIFGPITRLPPVSRILALVGLVVAAGTSLLLGRTSVIQMAKAFAEEIELLRNSGVTEIILRTPFFVLGISAGLLGAMIYLGCYWGVWGWTHKMPAIRETVPAFVNGGALITALGLLSGGLLGALGGALWYPQKSQSLQ